MEIRAEDHALLQPMFQAKLVDANGTLTPELVKALDAAGHGAAGHAVQVSGRLTAGDGAGRRLRRRAAPRRDAGRPSRSGISAGRSAARSSSPTSPCRSAARRAARRHRPQRRRQIDPGEHDLGRDAGRPPAGSCWRNGCHPAAGAAAGPGRHRPHLPDLVAVRRADQPAERLLRAAVGDLVTAEPVAAGRVSAAIASEATGAAGAGRDGPPRRPGRPRRCRTATSASSSWRWRWPGGRTCCCSTSRWPGCRWRTCRRWSD